MGEVVSKLRTALNEGRGGFAPDTNPVLAVDGVFGPITASAVRGTQELNNALVDGIAWMQTWAIPVHAAGQVTADLCGVSGPGLATWHFIGLRGLVHSFHGTDADRSARTG
jgi:peptidoglycan hydrolase-like protein with peptidoglycan-binding domain